MVEEINNKRKAIQLGVQAEIAARLKLKNNAPEMKKQERPKQDKRKHPRN